MAILRAIFAATAVELAVLGAACGLLGLAGSRSGWLDLFAQLAPLWLLVSLVAAIFAWPALAGFGGRAPVLILALVGVVSSAALIAPELLRPLPPWRGPPPPRALTFLTYNLWSQNFGPSATIHQILAQGADVVALQEMRGFGYSRLKPLEAAYPFQSERPSSIDEGLYSKRPWITSGFSAGVSWGVTTAPDGLPVMIATTHLGWPIPTVGEQKQRASLTRELAGLQRPDLIFAGDFNLAPWSWALRRLDAALQPLTRRERAIYSWPANIALLNRPAPLAILPIDHVYAGPAWRTVQIERLARSGSDHYGLRIVLTREPASR